MLLNKIHSCQTGVQVCFQLTAFRKLTSNELKHYRRRNCIHLLKGGKSRKKKVELLALRTYVQLQYRTSSFGDLVLEVMEGYNKANMLTSIFFCVL